MLALKALREDPALSIPTFGGAFGGRGLPWLIDPLLQSHGHLPVSPHVFPLCLCPDFPFHKDASCTGLGPTLMTSVNHNYFSKTLSSNITVSCSTGVKISTYELERGTQFSP